MTRAIVGKKQNKNCLGNKNRSYLSDGNKNLSHLSDGNKNLSYLSD